MIDYIDRPLLDFVEDTAQILAKNAHGQEL
jgi:hypothetical protein